MKKTLLVELVDFEIKIFVVQKDYQITNFNYTIEK